MAPGGARSADGVAGDRVPASGSSQPFAHPIDAFRRSLQAGGYVEGRNVTLQFRWADGEYHRLPCVPVGLDATKGRSIGRRRKKLSASALMFLLITSAAVVATKADAQGLSPYYGAQQYAPPSLPLGIIAPERPRGTLGQRKAAPPIAVVPLDPLAAEPTPTTPLPAPIESKPHPLAEWCGQEVNAKAPLCRNIGASKVQR
jgi:hypothetical protein